MSDHWYVRRGKVEKGPFPKAQIARFIVLGRIRDTDELSRDRAQWYRAGRLKTRFVPEMAAGKGDAALAQLRRREDERSGSDRRHGANGEGDGERRRGPDRRRSEPEADVRYRAERERRHAAEVAAALRSARVKTGVLMGGITGVVAIILALAFLAGPGPDGGGADCAAPPAPGVVWSNCRLESASLDHAPLSGAQLRNARVRGAKLLGAKLDQADLAYAELTGANLSYADLRGASLLGADLRRADLTYADLRNADLGYADLSEAQMGGAELGGARLGNTIWVDSRTCASGSVGACVAGTSSH